VVGGFRVLGPWQPRVAAAAAAGVDLQSVRAGPIEAVLGLATTAAADARVREAAAALDEHADQDVPLLFGEGCLDGRRYLLAEAWPE
jgi:hypothetical protein